MLAVVQFPHPGREHNAKAQLGDVFPWNSGEHKRKFLEVPGTWRGEDDREQTGRLRFWGEYEPESRVEALGAKQGDLPRYLHMPLYPSTSTGPRQNTDPIVLGGFWYSNCRQHQLKDAHSPTKMQALDPGSLVVFGSRRGGGFVLDTVLVVGRSLTYGREDIADLPVPQHVRDMALHPLYSDQDRHLRFTLHEGRTAAAGPGPYSFVPALPSSHGEGRFARPQVRLSDGDLVNDNLAMAVRVKQRNAEQVAQVWEELRQLVLDAGLVLGTHLEVPPRSTAAAGGRGGSARC